MELVLGPNPDSFNPFGGINPPTTNVGTTTKYDWRGEVRVTNGQTLVLGLEDETQTLRTDSTANLDPITFLPIPTTTNASTGNKAAYIELQSEFSKRLYLVSNIRLDDDDSFGPHTTWRLAPVFIVPGTETKLKATYGTGFKAPTLTELYVNNPSIFQFANPNLLPETSVGYDFGFEQSLFHDRLSFGATYFNNNVRNCHSQYIRPKFQRHLYERRRGENVRRRVFCIRCRNRAVKGTRRLHVHARTR